ncbi:MAG: AsmA family protein [Bryobacteraceae bacterium]
MTTVIVIFFLLLGVIAPYINAAAFGTEIQRALQSALGRKVQIGKVHFTILSGPGFLLEDVSIGEDPRFGLEPFAFVKALNVRVRPDKLLLGRIQISSLQLDRASLNLVKQSDGTWNFVELIDRLSSPRRAPLGFFPTVELTGARIDFKLGVRKTTFYLADTDLDLYPERSGRLSIRFAGSPSRTDRSGTGFGHFRGSASWLVNVNDANSNALEGDVTLDPSNLSELTTLFQGYDIGIHGTVGMQAHLEGPASALRLTGELDLGDVHRWDLMPKQGEYWRIGYRGSLDLTQQRFEFETLPGPGGHATPVTLQLRASRFLTQPSWSVLARLDKAPAGNLLPLAQRMGIWSPAGLSLAGTLDGVVGYSNRAGMEGGVALNDLAVTLPGVPALEVKHATATISSGNIHLAHMAVSSDGKDVLEASADYSPDTRSVAVSASADRGDLKVLTKVLRGWFTDFPALSSFEEGAVTGQIHYSHDASAEPVWNGLLQVSDGTLQAAGLMDPVTNVSARISFDELGLDATRLSALAAGVPFRGEYHYSMKGPRHERVRLELNALDVAQAESLLEPSLRSSSLFSRLRGRRQLPAWLASRNLEGDIMVNQTAINGVAIGSVRAHFIWDAASIQVSSLQVNLDQGSIRAKGSASLSENNPRYRLTGDMTGLPWKGGHLDVSGHLETAGTGRDILRNLRSAGVFNGEDLSLTPDVDLSKLTGRYQVSFEAGWPSVRLVGLQATQDEESWDGEATSQSDGKLVFELVNGRRQLHVVSTLSPSVDENAAAAPGVTGITKPAR